MSESISRYIVDWRACVEVLENSPQPFSITDPLDEGAAWVSELVDDEDWNLTYENWSLWFKLNEMLIEKSPRAHRRIASKYPVLKEVGVIWNEDLSYAVPNDTLISSLEGLLGAFEPKRVTRISDELDSLSLLSLRMDLGFWFKRSSINEWKHLFSFTDYVGGFFKPLRLGFREAADNRRGIVTWG